LLPRRAAKTALRESGERRALLARLLAEKAERPLKVPASPGQKRLWFAMRAAPGSPLYNCPLTIEIRGEVVAEALESALQTLAARHEALRTTFLEEEGELFQIVAPKGCLRLERSTDRSAAKAFARLPFDLVHGPLYRVALVTLSSNESLILLNAHHLVSDGWSQGILLRELLVLYQANLRQDPVVLPPLPLQYADFARWERARELPPSLRAFWARALAGVAPLRLPLDFARPAFPTPSGARISLRLPASDARAVARREDASLFQVVLAAFQMVLSTWCQQQRFVVGTPAHNRNRAEVEGIVGFFVSTVPIPADFSSDPTLAEAFARVRQSAVEALAHGDVRFEDLVALSKRAPGAPPLVQVLFVWQECLMPELDLGETGVRAREEDTGTSKFDVTLSLRPEGDALSGHLEFATDLFHPETVRWMIERLAPMLGAIHRTPAARLSMALGDSAPAGVNLGPILGAANDTAKSYACAVLRCADAPAIDSPAGRLTFAELDRAASALAARFRAQGHRDGEPVALLLATGVEAIVGIVAAWKCRSAYVPLDPSWPEARVERILREVGARICLRESDVALEALLDREAERHSVNALASDPTDLAYVIFTSGSTGEPKGVQVSHRNLAHLDRALDASVYGPEKGRPLRVGIFGSLVFDTTVKQLVRLLRGDCLCPVPQELKASPAKLVRHLGAAALDVVDMTPSWVRILLEVGLERPLPRTFLLGGEPIDPSLWHDLAMRQARGEARFVNLYGPTEATVDATWTDFDPTREPSIGKPLPNTRLWLLDGRSRLVPPGFVGEVAIAGEGVALGYWNRPEQTAQAFVEIVVEGQKERVYRTGDFARFRGDGHLVFLGRRDRQIKRNGQRIELDEVEAALRAHEAVAEAAAVEVEGRIVAWCVRRREANDLSDLTAHAARILPRGFLPDEYHWSEALPRNTSGKIDHTALRESRPVEPRRGPRAPALRGEHQEEIARIWTDLLGSPPADSRADFFAAGGDSLLGLRLLARIEKRFGVPLDVALLASSPTPETLAAALAPGSRRDAVVWIRRGSMERTPVAFVHATGGDVFCYRTLVSLLAGEQPVLGLPAPPRLPESLLELASEHASSVERELGSPEVVLAGWSLGGVVALEAARRLRARDIDVPLVLLLDARLPMEPAFVDDPRLPELSRKLLFLWRNHVPAPYDGDALLLRASAPGEDLQAARWRELVPRLAVITSRVDHHEMMQAPQVANVAQVVARALHGVRNRRQRVSS
jgi:amino acid adenylation domain-containing protein